MLKKNNYLLFIFLQFNIDYISGDISMIVSYERDYLVVPFFLFYLVARVGYVPFFLYVFFSYVKVWCCRDFNFYLQESMFYSFIMLIIDVNVLYSFSISLYKSQPRESCVPYCIVVKTNILGEG